MTPTLPTTVVLQDIIAGVITTMTMITTTATTTTTMQMALATERLLGMDKAVGSSTSCKAIRMT